MLNPKKDNLENRFLKPEYPFKLGDDILSQSHITELLGFYLNDSMTWNEHVKKLV